MAASGLFNAHDGDIILRSSAPSANFSVHRSILSIASPVFRDMFGLPQLPSTAFNNKPNTPVVDLSEDTETLDALLRLIYPVRSPVFESLSALVPILAAAAKYDMEGIMVDLRRQLVSPNVLTPETALQIFAIADRFGFEDELRLASRCTLHIPLYDAPLSDDLRNITAHSFFRLMVLHRHRMDELSRILDNIPNHCRVCGEKGHLDFTRRAKASLAKDLSGSEILTVEFLFQSWAACENCVKNIIYGHLDALRERFKAVRDTV